MSFYLVVCGANYNLKKWPKLLKLHLNVVEITFWLFLAQIT